MVMMGRLLPTPPHTDDGDYAWGVAVGADGTVFLANYWDGLRAYTYSGYLEISEDPSLVPNKYALKQNYPNPFNPNTTLRYGLTNDSNVSLVIYDVRGQVVQTLKSGHQSAGWYDVVWNGETADGKTISTGIYFARLVVGDYSQVIKMLYLK